MLNTPANNSALFWHRRDLRIADNHGLFQACKRYKEVIPVFIFDTTILDLLESSDARVSFIYESIQDLAKQYQEKGNQLEVFVGDPTEIIPDIAKKFKAKCVFSNKDYETYALERDTQVASKLNILTIEFSSWKDHVIFEENEVTKDDGLPYTVFTPYMNKWKKLLIESSFSEFNSAPLIPARTFEKRTIPTLKEVGFQTNEWISFPEKKIPVSVLENYHNTRDLPYLLGTSRLSIHLRFGTLSIRKLASVACASNEKYFNELIWRDFYAMILFHFPHSENHAFKKNYEFIPWENDEHQFAAWCAGKTGYPMVDAGMRELNETGFMHNRVRMITASFLCKHLLIDWKWGERYFASKLLDFDLASNIGGWQWAASTGCDAVPYFRIFNPTSQQEKFDPNFEYIKQWIPEFGTENYPKPIIEHTFARNRAIERYKTELTKEK